MKNIFYITGTYVATLVGAGLASGAETAMFFSRYGRWGGAGVFVCSVIFALFIYALFSGLKRTGTDNLNDYMNEVIPFGKNLISSMITLFMICVYSAMIAGAGELICAITGIDKIIIMVLFNLMCIFIIILPIKRIVKFCGVIGIVIGIAIIVFSFRFLLQRGIEAFNIIDNWIVSSVSYGGYNILSCIGILCPLVMFANTKKSVLGVSLFSGIMIFLILIGMYCAISTYYGKINLGTFPMLTLAKRQGDIWYYVYLAVFFCAILTTAISSAYSVYTSFLNVTKKVVSAGSVYIISVISALSGFDILVGTVYKICGIIGVIIPVIIITTELKNGIKSTKTQ